MTDWTVHAPQRITLDGPVSRLDVHLLSGRLNVVATDGPPGSTSPGSAAGRSWWSTATAGSPYASSDAGGSRTTSSGWARCPGCPRVDVSIAVPADVLADLELVEGSLVASGLRGETRVDVTSGRITLMGLGGRTSAKTISGPIEALGVAGDLTWRPSPARSPSPTARPSGSARRPSPAPSPATWTTRRRSDIRLEHHSGEITVRVREDSDLAVRLHATSGRVTSGFPQVRGSGVPGCAAAAGRARRRRRSGSTRHAISGSIVAARPARCDDDRRRSCRERRVQPRPAPALPAQAARRGPQARVRADPPAGEPVPRPLRALGRHHLSPAGPDGGRRAGHPHRGRRPQGLRDHRRRPGRAGASGPASWPRWRRRSTPRWPTCPPSPTRSSRGYAARYATSSGSCARPRRQTRSGARSGTGAPAPARRPASAPARARRDRRPGAPTLERQAAAAAPRSPPTVGRLAAAAPAVSDVAVARRRSGLRRLRRPAATALR